MVSLGKKIFKLHLPFEPSGDQPGAIKSLCHNRPGWSVLLGVTGSGKTFTLANVIANQNKPVLILSTGEVYGVLHNSAGDWTIYSLHINGRDS